MPRDEKRSHAKRSTQERAAAREHLNLDPAAELAPDAPDCPVCGGQVTLLGTLGRREHYRCRSCGWDCSITAG